MNTPLRVLVTGGQGQLGSALSAIASGDIELRSVARAELDITDEQQVASVLASVRPQVIINAAAYTAVDKAETEHRQATRINSEGPGILGRAARGIHARLIHVSTDFVFDGRKATPYLPGDATAPLNVYGATKLAGEQAALTALPEATTIVRTAWVYSAGGQNFVRTMLRLMRERGRVSVVSDQIGTPTSADSLARALLAMAPRADLTGIFHWTDLGVASWYDFAVAIKEEAVGLGLLPQSVVVAAISSAEYPTAAKRPAFSVLDCRSARSALGLAGEHWRTNLRAMLQELAIE